MSNLTEIMLFSCCKEFLVQFGPPYSSCFSKPLGIYYWILTNKLILIMIIYCWTAMLQML